MKKINIISIILFFVTVLFLFACDFGDISNKKRQENKQDTINNEEEYIDPNLIEIGLPFIIDSTDYIIFPISLNQESSRNKSSKRGTDYSYSETDRYMNNSNSEWDSYNGSLINLGFQNINNEKITFLQKKNIQIFGFYFLRNIFYEYGLKYILLEIKDEDTNQDEKIDYKDISSLYICEITGRDLQKLSPAGEHLESWKIIAMNGKIYFRTIENTNDDEKYNYNDKINLYQVDLLNNHKISKIKYK